MNPFKHYESGTIANALSEDDRFELGGNLYKVLETVLKPEGAIEIHFFPVFVDYLAQVSTMTVPSQTPFKIYKQ